MKKSMKLVSILLALTMMLSLAACGGSSGSSAPAATEAPAAEAPAAEAPAAEAAATEAPAAEPAVKTELDAIKEAGVLTVAISPDFAPMEFVDSSKTGQDQYVGFDVSLAKYLAECLGVQLEIQAMSFDACQTAVAMDAVDMSISGYSWTETRAENFELSDPYFPDDNESRQVLLIKEENYDKFTSPEDFKGVDVGAQNASLQMDLLTKQLPDAIPYPIGEIGVGVMELQSGNIDALAVADGNADAILVNQTGLVKCQWEFDVSMESDGNVVMMHKGETALLAAVNEALANAMANGLYSPWYAEAKEMAGLDTAVEVSIEDEPAEEAPAEEAPAEEAPAEEAAS